MPDSTQLEPSVDTSKVFSACLLAGKVMVESGSEMYRVEDTMKRIAVNGGVCDAEILTTTTMIIIGKMQQPNSQLIQVKKRTLDLEKVARVNSASRAFATKKIDLAQLTDRLHKIDKNAPTFSLGLQFFSAGVVSATLMIPFSGQYDWYDLPAAFIIGALGFIVNFYIDDIIKIKFISEFTASLIIGLLAVLTVHLGLGQNANNIIIGAVMPLVPGLPLTNALRDLLAGQLMAGITRGVEALLSAGAIGSGIALVFHFVG